MSSEWGLKNTFVGHFKCSGLTWILDVLSQSSPEIKNKYVHQMMHVDRQFTFFTFFTKSLIMKQGPANNTESLLVVQDDIRKPNVSGRNTKLGDTFIFCRVPWQPVINPVLGRQVNLVGSHCTSISSNSFLITCPIITEINFVSILLRWFVPHWGRNNGYGSN